MSPNILKKQPLSANTLHIACRAEKNQNKIYAGTSRVYSSHRRTNRGRHLASHPLQNIHQHFPKSQALGMFASPVPTRSSYSSPCSLNPILVRCQYESHHSRAHRKPMQARAFAGCNARTPRDAPSARRTAKNAQFLPTKATHSTFHWSLSPWANGGGSQRRSGGGSAALVP